MRDVDLKKVSGRNLYRLIKRLADIILSLIVLILLIIPTIIIALLIWHDDRGPVFYTQTRVGKDAKKFKMYKFRTMVPNADQLKSDLMDKNEFMGAMFKIQDDPRVTKVGHYLRIHGLDELPQFLNVLIGDMSLVGPRPPLPDEVKQYSKKDFQRLLVTPGITGLWQVTPRQDYSFSEMLELDIKYINTCNIWLDLKIMFKTAIILIMGNDET